MSSQVITGRLVNVLDRTEYPVEMRVAEGRIASIQRLALAAAELPFILPGFIDAHVHVESSMLIPSEFGRLAVVHGTVASVSDPHEIANVCGRAGVDFMIADGRRSPFKFHFGAPSCVPATRFETAGATLDSADVAALLDQDDIFYLSEMMNFPGALNGDPEVMQKIVAAQRRGKPIDGHAPGLRGEMARRYAALGISTDHECFTLEEALDKLAAGMKIIIREGSAARNFDALAELIGTHPDRTMFCSDDKHPDSLVEGHIDRLCARAVARGIDPFLVIRTACVNPVEHYKLPVGQLRVGDAADFILVDDLVYFRVRETWIDGQCVARHGLSLLPSAAEVTRQVNRFHCAVTFPSDFRVASHGLATYPFPVIGAIDGQLITEKLDLQPTLQKEEWIADPSQDILKLAVVNRYAEAPVATAFIRHFGLRQGALASSVAHDAHNIVAVGTDDASLSRAVNLVIAHQGGVSCVSGEEEWVLPLPVAGLMSAEDGYRVAARSPEIDNAAKEAGATLSAPFMTLSFMALLVIPHLKLSDKGLFDGDAFRVIGT